MLQNLSVPDATYREKVGKKHREHRGCTGNVEESVGKNGSIVTDYQFDVNNKSDSEFLKEHLDQIGKQEEKTILVTDGAYSGLENTKAVSKNK